MLLTPMTPQDHMFSSWPITLVVCSKLVYMHKSQDRICLSVEEVGLLLKITFFDPCDPLNDHLMTLGDLQSIFNVFRMS